MEHEIDPLAVERSNNTDIEEQKPLPEEGNLLDLQVAGIKTECMDHSYDVKTETTVNETPVPTDFPILKSEDQEENVLYLHMIQIKTECMDKSCDLKSEETFDETPVPYDFPIVKCEVQEEVTLEVTAEEDEVLTDG
ncbi:uncharacterized protein [Periplaneta americana]